jgi:transposase
VTPEPPAPVSLPAAESAAAAAPGRAYRLAERTRTRYAEVRNCLARGLSRAATARELNLVGDLPELRSFAAGIRRDLSAVINGLTLEHSSGAVEGNVTRVKRLKRDGYGRAKFDLLRAQKLIAA